MEADLLFLKFKQGGVHLPNLGLWLDPHEPQTGPERVFVSHAHSDHVAPHREVILSEPTSRLMAARMPGERLERVLPFRERVEFNYHDGVFSITLLPAGHIFGSAMSLVEASGRSLLFTGDFKLRKSLSAETCEPRHADVLVMETTFGRPHYRFPPTASVLQAVVRFCREALDNDETPVLLGYSLGKSQELLCGLGEAGLPIMLHGTVHRLTEIYQHFGQCFPPYERYDASRAKGKVLLCPPNVANSAMLRKLGPTRSAILTGWAVDPNCRFRYQCDAAFPLSDHADFPELIEFVRQVQPSQVYTLHGFAADFAATLRSMGYAAQAVSEDEQLTFGLAEVPRPRIQLKQAEPVPSAIPKGVAFLGFANACAAIGARSSKLEKTRLLAEFLRPLQGDDAAWSATWFSGRPFSPAENKVLQAGWAVLRDALTAVTGVSATEFHQVYLKHSDLGETAAELLERQAVTTQVSVPDVAATLEKLRLARGPTAKTPVLAEALSRCQALEAKFLVKIITGDLRIGLKEGLVEDAIALAYSVDSERVRNANLLLGDVGETARLASENRLHEAHLRPFRPIKFMLASPEPTAQSIWDRLTGAKTDSQERPQSEPGEPLSVWLEDKYDGVRCQLHKVGSRVELYSRDLKTITRTFPDLAEAIRLSPQDFVLDGEIVAMRGGSVLPFSELQKRLGRRDPDLFMRDEVPIRLVAFDLLWFQGKDMLERPLRERRASLEALSGAGFIDLANITTVQSAQEIDAAFDAARKRGNEGLMIKDPRSPYTPGRRGLSWLKLKKAYATLDCVVVGAEFGHGKRNKVLSDYTFAVRDETTGALKTIGKAYSGLTDPEIAQLTNRFLKTARSQHGRFFVVPPEVVLEIAFDRLQPSSRHDSGLAMRFPRIVRIRDDKKPEAIDTMQTAWKLADSLAAPTASGPEVALGRTTR